MSEKPVPNPRARLAALVALVESDGWSDVQHELATRYERAVKGACDLASKTPDQRTGCAGAATELDQLRRHVPSLISSLTAKIEEEKRRLSQKQPASS